MQGDDFAEAIDIIPGRFSFVWIRRADSLQRSAIAANSICYCVDNDLVYEPFFADFGPLNLGKAYRFYELTNNLLKEAEHRGKRLYFYTGPQLQYKANAAVLVGIFQVLALGRSADDAYRLLVPLKPFQPFRDASCGVSQFHLTVHDCIKGIEKAVQVGFLNVRDGNWNFDVDEYEHFEQVENGDLNWIVPGKLVAFSGPAARPNDYVGFRAMVPEDYWSYFRNRAVSAIVRLNKKVYERKRFLDGGFRHHELYFPDGSCPSEAILLKFLELAEAEPGCLAIHCKAGLGRTGVLICCYIMKHYRFTAEEVIGYIRICRPGSVIGPQQTFVREVQNLMWHEGDLYRKANPRTSPPPLAWTAGRIGATAAASAAAAASAGVAAAAAGGKAVAAGGVSMMVDATGEQIRSRVAGGAGPPLVGRTPSGKTLNVDPSSAPSINTTAKSISDLSLTQLQERLALSGYTPGANSSLSSGPATPSTPPPATPSYYAANATPTSNISSSSSRGGLGSRSGISGGPPTPTRTPAPMGPLGSGLMTSSILSASRPATSLRAAPAAAGQLGGSYTGRSPSAPRERSSSVSSGASAMAVLSQAASLRATLHTDTVQAAARPKAQLPDSYMSQSSDFVSTSSWRTPLAGAKPSVARVLAPNGQPRKVPASAMMSQMQPGALTHSASGSAGRTSGTSRTSPYY